MLFKSENQFYRIKKYQVRILYTPFLHAFTFLLIVYQWLMSQNLKEMSLWGILCLGRVAIPYLFSHHQFLYCLGSAFNGCFNGVLRCFVPQMIDLCFDDKNVEFYKLIAQIALELGSLFFSLQYISLVHIFFFLLLYKFAHFFSIL